MSEVGPLAEQLLEAVAQRAADIAIETLKADALLPPPEPRKRASAIEQHLTSRQVAELLSTSQQTVLRLAQRGVLPSVKWGHERRYPESGIKAYLETGAQRANPMHGRYGRAS